MAILLNNQTYSDVTFIVESKPIYAHRCILSSRCELMEKMLDGPMLEAESSEIKIPEISYPVFLSMLEFLYTENAKILKENPIDKKIILELMCVADQYLLNDLKLQCELCLTNSINVENVCEMLELADIHRTSILRKQCIEFIMNNFSLVIIMDEFINMNKILLKEIMQEVSHRGVYIGIKPSTGNNCIDSSQQK